jgi:hypothetical protein
VQSCGPELTAALLTAVGAGPAGLTRVHRAAAILCHLPAALCPRSSQGIAPDPQRQLAMLMQWLGAVAADRAKTGSAAGADAAEFVREAGEAMAGLLQEGREQGGEKGEWRGLLATGSGRRMKKALRSFAERQMAHNA